MLPHIWTKQIIIVMKKYPLNSSVKTKKLFIIKYSLPKDYQVRKKPS